MGEVFVTLLNRSITAGWFILAVLCFRLVFRKSPKWVNCLLWGVVAVRLVCPFSIESQFSLLPSAEPVKSGTVVEGEVQNYIPSIDSRLAIVKNPAKEYRIRVTIPAGSTKPVCYSDDEISPKGNSVTFYAGEGLGDTELSLLPIEVREENAYDEPAYLTPGMPVKMDVEKGAWFKIGVNVQNPTNEDKVVYVSVRGVEVRIAGSMETPVIANTFAISNGTDLETKIFVNDNYYSMITDISRTEAEDYANYIKQLFMEHDWFAISSEIAYPITISGTTYTDSTVFLDASDNFDSNLNEDFFSYLKEEDCVEMFINSQGIMLGATGQVWIADVLDDKSNSHGLKIITINDLLKE